MTKVFAYIPTPGGMTGAPRRLLTLADALAKRSIKVCVASRTGSELLEQVAARGHETMPLDPTGGLGLAGKALFRGGPLFRLKTALDLVIHNLRVWRRIRTCGADAVWVRGSKGIAFAAIGALLSRRPLMWDVGYEMESKGMVRWLHRVGLWVASAVICQYSGAPNSIFGHQLSERYPHKFYTVLPGIDMISMEPFRLKREERKRVGGGSLVMLQVGTICNRKNQILMVEALHILKEEGKRGERKLWLAYDEIHDSGFLERLRDYELERDVKLLGWRDDVKDLMVQADVLVMPSRDEGVPNAVQESMAIGLPVLVSQAGGMPEIVSDGETGWVLGMDDPIAWAERIRLCQEDRSQIREVGQKAAVYASVHFGTARWGKEYSDVLENIVNHAESGSES